MNIKVDTSYFELKAKPSLLHPLTLEMKPQHSVEKISDFKWDFRYLEEFSHIDQRINKIRARAKQLITQLNNDQKIINSDSQISSSQVSQILQQTKDLLQKCEYFNINLSSSNILTDEFGLLNFYKYPGNFKICTLLTQVQRSLKAIEQTKDVIEIEKRFPLIGILQKVTIKQILSVLKSLKENIYIPSNQMFLNLVEKLHFVYAQNLSLKENMLKNQYNLGESQSFAVYYQLLIYKECSTLEGLCHFLGYTKNILLDRKSGALAAEHETWVAIFQSCLKLYARNPQVRQNSWLQVDQILSTSYMDEEFTHFLLTSKVQDFSLASLNFYLKNLNKSDQEKFLTVAQEKILSLFSLGQAWKQAEDIVEHLDNECQGDKKEKIYNTIIKLIDSIFLNDDTNSKSQKEMIEIQIGLTFFIESMCKHLQISQKIFNKTNLNLIIFTLKKTEKKQIQIRLLYHIFTEFIINSYQESDELSSYLEANQEIVVEILPEIITLFNSNNYTLPKELYKLIFHSVSDIELLDSKIWRGIAQLYFVQCFQQTIDMEIFHTENDAKQKIADQVVEILKELTMNNAKQHILISQSFKQPKSNQNSLGTFMQFKAFKDELIFNNCLMMSTFFGEYLPLTELSGILSEFYTPIVPDIKWKSPQNQSLTLLSFIAQELPIDVLKATYKFLKQGFSINMKSFESLSTDFWNTYFCSQPNTKVTAIINQKQFSFQTYQGLHSLRLLDLVLNMINCVFDKLNENSQKSIKELKVMYEWGFEYIEELQPYIYPILMNCVVNQFDKYSRQLDPQTVEIFQLYSRTKNISILDMHLYEKYHVFQTFNDFNKIGQVIGHERASEISMLIYPCFIKKTKIQKLSLQNSDEKTILKTIFKLFVLIENTCLQEVMSDQILSKVSKNHTQSERYYQKVIPLIQQLKNLLTTQNLANFIEKPLYKRLISHLKLLMGKIYIPFMIKQAFSQDAQENAQTSSKKLRTLDNKFAIMKSCVEVIHKFDSSFEEHFAQLMQVIQENSQQKDKKQSQQKQELNIRPHILIKTLQMFFKCVLSNIKVRSFHIFKLIKLYLNETNTQLQSINQVIKFYIELLFSEFIQMKEGRSFNQEVKEKSRSIVNLNEVSRCKILTPQKNKDHISFADKILSPLKRQKISLEQLKLKKLAKSSVFTPRKDKQNPFPHLQQSLHSSQDSSFSHQDDLPSPIKKLIIKQHHLTTVQCSCTLSMFINLFARLNYSSLPTGVQHMLQRENDKIVYLDYLIQLTQILLKKHSKVVISQRDLEILSIDVFGNLSCILKGKLNEEIFRKFIHLAKMTLKLDLADQTVVTLPIKLLNQRFFSKPHPKKLASQQTSLNELTHISKFIAEFEEQPLAYELSIKSHIMKISPFIKSNIHVCNLEYIVGENKSSISKKIIETNYKLVQNVMGRVQARDLLKKYEKNHITKETLEISISHQAIEEMDNILQNFVKLYENIDFKSQTQTIQLYFYFKKICSLLFYAPELFSYILTKQLILNNKEITVVDIIFDTLKSTLVFFCEFYIICLKINSGFCSKKEILSVIRAIQRSSEKCLEENILSSLPQKVPLNFMFEVYIKLRLLNLIKDQNEQNSLRGLNFAIKQSQKFRFRFYKFIKINVPQNEEFLKKLDEQILSSLLKDLKKSPNPLSCQQTFVNKVQLMDLCLENILSHTMLDYAKMKLDNKLKDTFMHSQYSIKCLQSFNCDINTLKVLEEAEEEKSVSSGCEINDLDDLESDGLSDNVVEEIEMKFEEANERKERKFNEKNIFADLQVIKNINQNRPSSQSLRPKLHTDTFNPMQFTSQLQPFSVKQTSELKQWLQLTITSPSHQFTSTLLKQMRKSCQKLIGKENLSFNFEDPIYLQSHHQNDQIDITAFAINETINISSDCCIEDTSFCEDHDEAMIDGEMEETGDVHEVIKIGEPQYDEICEDELNCDGIIEEEDDEVDEQNDLVEQEINQIKISIVEQTHTNRFQAYQNQNHNAMMSLQEPSQDSQPQQQPYPFPGTDGSIQFTSSIKSLQNIDELQLQQISQQLPSSPIPQTDQSPQISINNQRQFHYTIDNFTAQTSHNRLNINNSNNNSSLVDTISQQVLDSNQPVTKDSIFGLIEEFTLNPEILKFIKLKLKKISNSELKKVHGITHGDLKDQVDRQMRNRGLYVAVGPGQYQNANEGSLFSISRLINQSFQIDQSKFYAANYKKCDKKTAEKQKIQKIPELSFNQWVNFVFLYVVKSKQQELKDKLMTETLLEGKNLRELLIKLLLNKENLVKFLEVLLNLLSCEKVEQTIEFFQTHIKLPQNINQQSQFIKSLPSIILNELIAKLITNRIGLPVLFKGKWNHETKKLIKYEFQCLISDSNLNNSHSQGEPLLEVFLRKSIELIYIQQSVPQAQDKKPIQLQTFVKSLSEYFRSVENFQSNEYPYYFIQDTIKLTPQHRKSSYENNLSLGYQSKPQSFNFSNKSKTTLCENLLATMKVSTLESLKQYQEVFYLMNYLDFETFSEFLELLIQKHKPLCDKIIEKQLAIVKRFKKSAYTQNLNKQKLAEIYWHMRKSSKSFLSTNHQEKQLQFFARLISSFSSTIFHKFKQSIFKFGYGKEENKKKQKISYLNKLLMNSTYENRFKAIKEEIAQKQKEYLNWKIAKSTEILRQDVLPIIEKIAASFNQCLKKWELLFEELDDVFGTEREERFILYKQCSEFYKIFLSFEMLLQSQETSMIRTMSSLKTKPSLESTRDMGVTGRRRSSLKLPRVSLASSLQLSLPQLTTPTFKSVFKSISPKFSFFSHMIDSTCPELKIHAKYSTIESKLKLLHQKNNGGEVTIEVRRDYIWQDTLPFLNEELADKNVKIKITQELGLDYGGIRREWITLIVKELLNPNLGLFELSVNGLAFQPSALSYLVPNHLFYFYKLGILVGKALKQNWLLEINFTKSFLKHVLGYTLYVEDLEDIDPDTSKSLLWILNNDIGDGDLGIDFTHSYEVLGKKHTMELIENGKEILVTQENKKEYVKLLAVHKMTQQIRQQSKAFMNGLEKVVPYQTLKLFSYKQLGIYLAGMPTVDVEEMKKHTRYQGFSQEDQTVKWFWETLATYTEQQKANFLFFLTGSYKVPYGGFKQNPISINKMPASTDYLPVAHTCFSVIDLPEYSSKEKLALLLDKALKEGKGFSVS